MDIIEDWAEIKSLFKQSFASSFHFAIASVNENGEPHVTPIGSLILGEPGKGIYFEKFPQQLPRNYKHSKKVCVLAVNSSKWFWLKSLLGGRFKIPPAIRLYGEVGELRDATDTELRLWQKRVKRVSFTKGHTIIWRDMSMVREIVFTGVEPVRIGRMTQNLY